MLILRGIGMLCILSAALWAGRELELRLKRHWLVLEDIVGGLRLLENEMLRHRSTLREALDVTAGRSRTAFGALLMDAQDGISVSGAGPFSDIWKQAAAKSRLQELLGESEYAELLALSQVLCSADPMQQQILFQRYEEWFQSMSREAEQRYREQGALYRKLAAAAGIFLVLLLI